MLWSDPSSCHTDSNNETTQRRKREAGPPSIDDLGDVPSTVDTENQFVEIFTGVSRIGELSKIIM